MTAEDGCRLWTTESGSGDPLVTCHGGPGLWDMFGPVASMLASRLRVVRWDQRGGGRSDRRGPCSLSRTLRDLDVVRQHYGLDRVSVFGHSWGAHLALRYALDHPERVDKLVYVSGTGLGWDWRPEYKRNFAARLGSAHARLAELRDRDRTEAEERELAVLQWSADFADPDKAVGYAERMATPWFEIDYDHAAAVSTDTRQTWDEPELVAACRDLPVPTLIVDGTQDIRPRWAVDSLAEALPNMTRVVLPNAGHVPWLEAPEEFRHALLEFLCPLA